MDDLDRTDRLLIAALVADGRASVTTLAGTLGVTRSTVQARMDRLKRVGIIKRFTVDLSAAVKPDAVKAVMMIELQGNLARQVTSTLRRKPEVVDLYSTNGTWDLVADLETTSLAEFDRVLREVREISGVLNSETCLLLNRA